MRQERAAYIQLLVPVILLGVLFALLRFSSPHYVSCDAHQSCITCQTLDTPAPRPPSVALPTPKATKAAPPLALAGKEVAEAPLLPPRGRSPPA